MMMTTMRVRAMLEQLGRLPAINLVPDGGADWTTASFGLGPFPARLVLVETSSEVWAEVALLDFPGPPIESAMNRVPYPSPEVTIRLEPGVAPILRYRMPYAEATEDEAVGLVMACAMYTAALASEMRRNLPQRRRAELVGLHGALRGNPLDLLVTPVTAYDGWPRLFGAKDDGPDVAVKDSIPFGHHCDDAADFVGLLSWWIESSEEPTIGTDARGYVRVTIGGASCVLRGDTTRDAVREFLKIVDGDGAIPYFSVVLKGDTVDQSVRIGAGQYPLPGFEFALGGDPGEPRWLTPPPTGFVEFSPDSMDAIALLLFNRSARSWPGIVAACSIGGTVFLQSARTTAVVASCDRDDGFRVMLPNRLASRQRGKPYVVAIEDIVGNDSRDVVIDTGRLHEAGVDDVLRLIGAALGGLSVPNEQLNRPPRSPAPQSDGLQETDAAAQNTSVSAARSSVVATRGILRVEPLGGSHWTEARIGFGPWAGRIVLDAGVGEFRCESQIAGVTDTSRVDEAVASAPFDQPQATYSLSPGPQVVTLHYARPLSVVDPAAVHETALLLLTATASAAYRLWDVLSPLEHARLARLGITSADEMYTIPDQMLTAAPVANLEWDERRATVDRATPPAQQLPDGVVGAILGPLGVEWDQTLVEIREVLDQFTSTMSVEVQRQVRDDEVYVQISNEGGDLFAEAVSNTYLEGASRLNETDMQRLGHLGWQAPAGADDPNWHRTYSRENTADVAEHIARTLRDGYGVDPDADGWLITWAEPPAGSAPAGMVPLHGVASAQSETAVESTNSNPIADYMAQVNATSIRVRDDDSAQFVVAGVPAVARRIGHRELRVSYVLATTEHEAAAKVFAQRHSLVGARGKVRITGDGERHQVLLTIEGDVDRFGDFDSASPQALAALKQACQRFGGDFGNLRRKVSAGGLVVPPLGAIGERSIDTFGEWHWGSRYIDPMEQYLFTVERVVEHLARKGHMFALSNAGHGANSYALNLVTSAGEVAAFVQHPWGGAYGDRLADMMRVNETYARLHLLMEDANRTTTDGPRWLILLSDFRGTCQLVDLKAWLPGLGLPDQVEDFETEAELFASVAGRLSGL
ncbi:MULTISPECIES: TY-Chap domain-containing protein [unclassified Nocardioides]|uniref:TY-Chap domain-containing protein n=1 Tax=unclassified Nocardioides TaxID=2615069 RepID=UPI0006F796BD|nr:MULTISPECIES: hypothetical protein [unclassified Nocardioides]KRA37899.1 hypothetical protein ASD81_04235 [Nocardioides sp. Root614]KRA91859.1 hypothetical protein ASD84_04500 [Nocardioides sp. Root682]